MSRVDDELARVVREGEAADPATPGWAVVDARRGEASAENKPRRRFALLIALLVMGAGILTLVFTNFKEAAIYSKGVDQLIRQRNQLVRRNVNVNGTLVKGTLTRRAEPCEYRFDLQKNGARVAVRYAQCIVPDTFRDLPYMDVDVTATGKLTPQGYFEANHIMAKCPSKYEMKARAEHGSVIPASAIAPGSRN
ncbi:MAG TPA: cytochrome c maturation protein CcmE [Polyangiaceae bacterium]|jgi:cytochrome c-type biogenesis protein CcmE